MTSRLAPPQRLDARLAELEAENRKLRKINKALTDRVERDMDTQGGNAFTLFQTAVMLESKVSERTGSCRRWRRCSAPGDAAWLRPTRPGRCSRRWKTARRSGRT